jgi:hypothetical protein
MEPDCAWPLSCLSGRACLSSLPPIMLIDCTLLFEAMSACSWLSRAGPPLKVQQMLERAAPLGIEPTLALLRGLNFGVEHLYLDPSPNNEAGAGYFMHGPPGAEQALLVQVRPLRCMPGVLVQLSVWPGTASCMQIMQAGTAP